jgi:hypothetical protein
MDLKPRRKVVVSETVPLKRKTLSTLIESIETLFSRKDKPTRILYQRGEDLQVEIPRLVETENLDLESGLVTPYQVVRQHCEIEVFDEINDDPLLQVCRILARLRKGGDSPTGIVVCSAGLLSTWVPQVDVSSAFGIPVYEDPDAPENFVFFCGSADGGTMVRDFEKVVACEVRRT